MDFAEVPGRVRARGEGQDAWRRELCSVMVGWSTDFPQPVECLFSAKHGDSCKNNKPSPHRAMELAEEADNEQL